MDLKMYFRRIREIEATISEPDVLVTSLQTQDGGKAGIVSEVPRELAARMIAEGRAVLASDAEAEKFVAQADAARTAAQKAEMAKKVQVTIVSEPESRASNRK